MHDRHQFQNNNSLYRNLKQKRDHFTFFKVMYIFLHFQAISFTVNFQRHIQIKGENSEFRK
jgi:hypothetical protein